MVRLFSLSIQMVNCMLHLLHATAPATALRFIPIVLTRPESHARCIHLDVLYTMKVSNVQKTWTNRDVVLSDTIRLCTRVK